MRMLQAVCFVGLVALSGCANLNSIHRNLDLIGPGAAPEGVAIDIKQRAILTNTRRGETPGAPGSYVVCAEPSPDALSAYVASLGATGIPLPAPAVPAGPSRDPFNVAGVAGETSASVGLRTQSIQLLRDLLFANCLTYLNGASSHEQYYALQRRSQNITLGLLAIEQLTGAVKADQASLNTSGSAATGADNVDKETEALKAAQSDLAAARKAEDTAVAALKAAAKNTGDQRKKVVEAQAAYDKATSDGKKAAEDVLKAETVTLDGLMEDEAKAQIEVADARRQLRNAEAYVAAAQRTLADAQRRVRASVTATASLGGGSNASGKAPEHVSKAVVEIVTTVLQFSSSAEDCSALIAKAGDLAPDGRLPAPAWLALQNCLKTKDERSAVAEAIRIPETEKSLFIQGQKPPVR